MAFDAPRSAVSIKGAAARLGWREVEDSFRVPLAGYCGSYHFELEAPPEMEITGGRFVGTRDGEPVQDYVSVPTQRAHFNLARLDSSDGFVLVSLRARSRELLGGAALFSLINAGALLFVLLRLHEFRSAASSDAVVAVLLVVPGVLIGYITRPSEHEVLASFLTGLRHIAFASSMASFAAALTLFAG